MPNIRDTLKKCLEAFASFLPIAFPKNWEEELPTAIEIILKIIYMVRKTVKAPEAAGLIKAAIP